MLGITENQDMKAEIKNRIEQIRQGKVPADYKKTKHGIFPKEWEIGPVGDLIQEYKSFSNDIESMPVYSSSRNGLIRQAEYYDRKESQKTNLGYKVVPPEYVTYRHMSDDDIFHFNINTTGESILVSAEYPVFRSNGHSDLNFLIPLLNNSPQFRYFCRTQKLGGTRTRLYFRVLETYEIVAPCLEEQQKIAKILMTQDRVIALREKLLAEKLRQKQYLMQVLLTGKKRLPGFSEPWKEVKLGDIFSERTETNHPELELLAITGTKGVIPRNQLDLKDNSSEDKSKYLKICVGDIGYNTMRMWQGVSAYSNYEGIVSPAYTILKPNGRNHARFFAYLFKLPEIIFLFYRYSQGLVDDTRNLKYSNFKKIRVKCPVNEKEQMAIADILVIVDQEIGLLRQALEQERRKKKALMQLLLSGIVRVKP